MCLYHICLFSKRVPIVIVASDVFILYHIFSKTFPLVLTYSAGDGWEEAQEHVRVAGHLGDELGLLAAARRRAARAFVDSGSIGEGPNHSNYSDQSSVRIL